MNRFTEDYMCVNHLINKCTCIHNGLLCPLQRRRQSRLCRLSSCSWREHDWPTTSMTKSLTDRVPLSWSTRTSCLLTAICSTHSQVITHTSSAFTCTRLTPGTRSGKENVFIDGLALSFKCNHKFKSLEGLIAPAINFVNVIVVSPVFHLLHFPCVRTCTRS